MDTPSIEHLSELSVQLYALEKQQNPVNYHAKRVSFGKKITPVLTNLEQAIDGFDGSPERLSALNKTMKHLTHLGCQ